MKEIALSGEKGKGKYALVDDEDYEEISKYKWHLKPNGYAARMGRISDGERRGKEIYMHRQVMQFPDESVDHIDQNKLNNCKSDNLRTCNASQNAMNRCKFNKTSSSSYKGVSFDKYAKKWRAQLVNNGQRFSLGFYSTEIEAARAYDKKARELCGEHTCPNNV